MGRFVRVFVGQVHKVTGRLIIRTLITPRMLWVDLVFSQRNVFPALLALDMRVLLRMGGVQQLHWNYQKNLSIPLVSVCLQRLLVIGKMNLALLEYLSHVV